MSTYKKFEVDSFEVDSFNWTDEDLWLAVVFADAPDFDNEITEIIDIAEICAAYRDFGESPEVIEYISMATTFLGNKTSVCLVFDEVDYSFELISAAQEEASHHDAGLIVLT